jgi:RNA polymerase sigma-70 factor (ECF subfamily)
MSPNTDIPDAEALPGPAEVGSAVAALPQRLRAVLIEVHFRDRSVTEAAWVLGVHPATVRARLREALRQLRRTCIDRPATAGGPNRK